ncbi:MAG: hypothetical protein K2Q23_08510 [Bryobacteraceae bacterium]|nr:hypothetical protein [Bryobacteraceae bacterium]
MNTWKLRFGAVCLAAALAAPLAWMPATAAEPVRKKAPAKSGKKSVARGPMESPLAPPPGIPADAARWMRSLTLRQQIAQLVVAPCFGDSPSMRSREYQNFANLVQNVQVGGLIVVNRVVNGVVKNAEPYEMASFLNRMQKLARVPLIVGGDFERGASMRVANTTKFPHLMAYGAAGDPEATKLLGAATAREARALGVHWVFAPDADVNNNPANPIINTRSFGENPEQVAAHVKAFIAGAKSDPKNLVLVTVKHFPGHGDTATDTHVGLATVTADRARLDQLELVPFRAAIQSGVDAVMTAHLNVPALEPVEMPATVSKNVLTGLLRGELGFKGLIVTDAMDMQGLSKQYAPGEAAVRALEAGADVLLMTPRPEQAIQGVVQALQQGRIPADRLRESIAKMLTAKVRLGLHKQRLVEIEQISEQIQSPDYQESAQRVAERALTLLKNENGVLPLRTPSESCVAVLAENRYSQQGRKLIEIAGSFANSCGAVVIAPFVNASAYRGNVALLGAYPDFVGALLESKVPVAMAAFGSPYLLKTFERAAAAVATCSTSVSSESALVRALFGEIGFEGKLPVTIPDFAPLGAGLAAPKRSIAVFGQEKPQ